MLARLAVVALALALALAAPARAAWQITFPTNSSGWTSAYGPNEISWTADGTADFSVYVTDPSMPDFSYEVAIYDAYGSGTVYFQSVQELTPADGWTIRLEATNGTTLATSDEFGVTSS
ncbi:hypothetical protein Q5752_004654 [Cryptotrichosporon argae]